MCGGGKAVTLVAMSLIWTGMVLLSIIFALVGDCAGTVSAAALEGAAAGIKLSLSLAGTLCLWSGLVKVMERAGLQRGLARLLSPLLRRLYPQAARDTETMGCICANVSANLLGLGNAATPLGIAAARRMKGSSDTASDELCRFVVMNTASIQLLPATVAGVRASAGAGRPFDILPAVWATSVCSVAAGLAAAFLFQRVWRAECSNC